MITVIEQNIFDLIVVLTNVFAMYDDMSYILFSRINGFVENTTESNTFLLI